MKTIKEKSAFPFFPYDQGLTKREYFAGLAMQGLLGSPATINNKSDKTPQDIASASVFVADALIVELNKRQ